MVTDEHIGRLVQSGIFKNRAIRSLSFGNNMIGVEGGTQIGTALKDNGTLLELYLSTGLERH